MQIPMEKLRGLCEDNDLTQTDIAEILGTSQTMYARYERGANELPLRHLITLCRFYNISADTILSKAPDTKRPLGVASRLNLIHSGRKKKTTALTNDSCSLFYEARIFNPVLCFEI